MKFPFFRMGRVSKSKNYLALFLKEEEGVILVLYENNGKMAIREKERFHYSNGWEHIVQDIDEVLFRLEQKLNVTLDQTIFFVYSHFIDAKAQDIKKPYIQKIKEIVKSLELHALGYIDCSEAILQYLEKKEEMPLTAILVELDKTNVGVFVYKGGRVAHKKILSRTDNLIDDLLKGFEELKGKFLLPARLILYNSKDLDDESTKILSYQWSEDYFIQLPRVEILREEETIESLISVFREQIMKEDMKVEERPPEKKEIFGFLIGEDIKIEEEEPPEKPVEVKSPFFLGINIRELIKRIRLPKVGLGPFNISRRLSIMFGIMVILLSLSLNEFFFHKASLIVYFPSDVLSKKVDVDALVGEKGNTFPVMVSTSSAHFDDSKPTTGKRDIGDNAKGTVTLHNFDDKEKVFSKGTVLETSGLQFSLDADMKVASSSLTTDGSAKLPGKGTGTATAVNIGPESNISKGQRFKVDDLSQSLYFAVNDNVFSGGTRKQVQTVSKKDIEDLKSSITNKAKNLQTGESSPVDRSKQEEVVIMQLSKIELRDLKFSKEIGEEATTVTLQATADTSYFYLNKDDFVTYLFSLVSPDVKQGFSLDKSKIHYSIDSAEKKNNNVTLQVSVDAKSIKQVPKDEILKNIVGKSKQSVESLLKKQYQAEGFELSIKEPLPLLNTILPFIKGNINVVISSL